MSIKTLLKAASIPQFEYLKIEEFLEEAKKNKEVYASAAERLLKAIGEPVIIDTSLDNNLSIIFEGRKIKTYPTLSSKFFGIEEDLERIVSFLQHAAQGLEESKQILFLLGDVGTGKSSILEELKTLMQQEPVYALAYEDGTVSPVFENPLGLFLNSKEQLEDEFGIHRRYLPTTISPLTAKRLIEYKGDLSKFKVVKYYPNKDLQRSIAKTEPLDDNNSDIGTLIGKVNMNKLQYFSQNDPEAYNFSGGLCRANRGILEMAEMYKAPIKTLNPLLEASQSRSYNGLEQIGSIPFDGLIISHSNKSEWAAFRSNPKNEALFDRINVVKIHYSLRYSENVKIYQKMLSGSDLKNNPCVPDVLDILSKFDVMTRLEDTKVSNAYSKMRVYNGDNIKDDDNRALPYTEYKSNATQDEGMSGHSTRSGFKILSQVFNYDPDEVAANPVHLFIVLESHIIRSQLPIDVETKYLSFIKYYLKPKYIESLGKQIQQAYIENYGDFAQAKFDRYFTLADHWIEQKDYRDPNTGVLLDRESINKELSVFEKAAGFGDPKDLRNTIVSYILRKRAEGVKVTYNSYRKLGEIIEASVFKTMTDLLPIISFDVKNNERDNKTHETFVNNMVKLGYTERQVKVLVDFYVRSMHS